VKLLVQAYVNLMVVKLLVQVHGNHLDPSKGQGLQSYNKCLLWNK
jgi:hypothetical protein